MLRILLVEDDPEDVVLLKAQLTAESDEEFQLLHAPTIEVAQRLACVEQYDVILVDYRLSTNADDAHGLDLVRWLYDIGVRMPMILLSAQTNLPLDGFEDLLEKGVSFLPKSELRGTNLWKILTEYIGSPLRVLILDDDADDLELMRCCLEAHRYFRYDISTASTLENARRKLEQQQIDVLLCDHMIGAYSSADLIREVLDNNIHTAVVLVTSSIGISADYLAMDMIARRKATFLSKLVMDTASLCAAISASRCKLVSERELDTIRKYS